MILAFSTSSPWTSVAALSEEGEVLAEAIEEAPRRASATCISLLQRLGIEPSDATAFLADSGPGSFTGVRVGVIVAKTFGYLYNKPVGGASAFDLISIERTVVVPSKKGEFFVREPGVEPYRTTDLPETAVGYGPELDPQIYPEASNFKHLLRGIDLVSAAEFIPRYLIDPSISIPKKPYAGGAVA